MNRWLSLPDETKKNAYTQIAIKTGMSAFAVEKDWWMIQTLAIIFKMDVAGFMVFKGGTSLSKAWKLIHRFSEDVDLAIDRSFFGFSGELSKNQRDKLKKMSGAYVAHSFFADLKNGFNQFSIAGLRLELVDEKESDKDRTIMIYYPNVIQPPGYLDAKVQIEITSRSLREPYSIQPLTSLVDEEFVGRPFAQAPIHIPTVDPERTFLEKIFLLHEEFHRPLNKVRVSRLSRHLYDLYQLSKTKFVQNALGDRHLYATLVTHRYHYTRIGGVNYNYHQPQFIDPIPIPEVMEAYRSDYKTMQEFMIFEENPPSFDDIILEMNLLKKRINALPWKFEMKFPECFTF